MALNELIAQGAQFKAPDLLGQYSNALAIQNGMQTNQMNQIKMDDLRRANDEQNRLRSVYAGIADYNDPGVLNKIGAVSPAAALKMGEFQQKNRESGAKIQKEGADTTATALKNSRALLDGVSTPEQFIQWATGNFQDPVLSQYLKSRGVTPEQSLGHVMDRIQKGEFGSLLKEAKLGSEKALENHFAQFDTGQQIGTNVMPKYGAGPSQVVQGTVLNKMQTPDSVASNTTQQRGQNMADSRARDRLSWESNPEAQATMAGAKEGAKIQAKSTVEAQIGLPAAMKHVEEVNNIITQMIGDAKVSDKGKIVIPEGGAKPHKGFQVSVGASAQPGFQFIAGTDKANFYALKDQITSDAFLTAYKDSLKGGGAITEIEGEKGTQALLRARTSQSEAEFVKALREFQQSNARVAESMATRAGVNTKAPVAAPAPATPQASNSVTAPDGQTYTFPDAASAAKFKKQAGL